METALGILAVLGVAALLVQLGRAFFSAVRGGVEAMVAAQHAEQRARRGDITGAREAEEEAARARRARLRAGARALLWLALLVIPPMTNLTSEIWSACAALWLFGAGPGPLGRPGVAPSQKRRESDG